MNIRSGISGLLRTTGLLSIAEKARFYLQKWKYKKANEEFKKNNPDFVLPPEFFIYETYRLNYKWYHDDGVNTAAEIITILSKQTDLAEPGTRILDWGCGPGRIVRHFPLLLPNTEIFATDYNEKYIEWCKENLKGINFTANKLDPPTSYSNSVFDAVIGLSIFTHLSEKGHVDWINELYRIIKPGRYLYITTHGKAYYSKLTAAEKKLYDTGHMVTRQYSDEGNRLYSSFQPKEFMQKLLKEKFQIVEFVPGKVENDEPAQDIWLLQKS
jgi:SAM-dependent methyltransferase